MPGAETSSSQRSSAQSQAKARDLDDTAELCGVVSACCSVLVLEGDAPGCTTVASSGDETLCGLALEGVQASQAGLDVILVSGGAQCGAPPSNGNPTTLTDPACVALQACGATLPAEEKATAQMASFLNHGNRCSAALAYFESQEKCGSSGYDAGAWTGLLPLQGDAGVSTGSASHAAP